MKKGARVKRPDMAGWVAIQQPNLTKSSGNTEMTIPFIYCETIDGDLVPWSASHRHLLADDWEVVT